MVTAPKTTPRAAPPAMIGDSRRTCVAGSCITTTRWTPMTSIPTTARHRPHRQPSASHAGPCRSRPTSSHRHRAVSSLWHRGPQGAGRALDFVADRSWSVFALLAAGEPLGPARRFPADDLRCDRRGRVRGDRRQASGVLSCPTRRLGLRRHRVPARGDDSSHDSAGGPTQRRRCGDAGGVHGAGGARHPCGGRVRQRL